MISRFDRTHKRSNGMLCFPRIVQGRCVELFNALCSRQEALTPTKHLETIMSTNITDRGSEGETHLELPSDTNHQPAVSPNHVKEPFYQRYVSLFEAFRLGKKVEAPKPVIKLPPRIWKSFTSLGTNLLGQTTDIDDRQNIFRDGIIYMSSVSRDSAEKLNSTAAGLLSNKQPRPTSKDFLARPTQAPFEKYPIARRIDKPLTPSTLPDATLVFQRLLSSGVGAPADGHPNSMSSMTFAIASLISLSLVRIKDEKPEYNETSPLLDLSPLYGVGDAESNLVRAKDGRGMLSPDCFYENRVMLLPPAVSALLILWNRNHNYIARHLLLNNEGKKWVDPSKYPSSNGTLSERLAQQDDEIFRIARSINCIHFKNIVSEDFLKVLIGLPNVGKSTNLNILADLKQSEKGNGHDSSLEFSLLYNWSALMGPTDVEGIKEAVEEDFEQPFDTLELADFKDMLNGTRNHRNSNRRQRHYAGLQRGMAGRFEDEDLVKILQDATENAAGTPGARRISSSFRAVEIMVIERARRQGVTSLNEFRKYLGLKPLKSFKEWNTDPDVAKAAEDLYGTIDNLELYPGLQAEEVAPGSGLSFGYTMTNGLLVDLVTIMRSDPCFTTELTPGNLTRWGYGDCTAILNNGAFGAMLPKLLQRNLSRNYAYDNIYTLFPLTCPKDTKRLLALELPKPEDLEMYDFERQKPRHIVPVETKATISYVFNSPNFQTIYEKDLKTLTSGHGYFLGIDDKMRHDHELMMTMFALIPDKGALARYATYFGNTAAELIAKESKKNNGHQTIDIVKDVINATSTQWVCEALCGLRVDGPSGSVDMHDKFGALFAYVFRNIDPEKGWASREVALKASRELRNHIELALPKPMEEPDETYLDFIRTTAASVSQMLSRTYREMQPDGVKLFEQSAQTFLDRMVKSAKNFPLDRTPPQNDAEPIDFVEYEKKAALLERSRSIANVLGLAVVVSVNYAQACAQAVDFYLDEQYSKERKAIIQLSTLPLAEARKQDANRQIMGYIREAQRLGQPLGLWREALNDDYIPQANGLSPIPVKTGDRIFADLHRAHTNPQDFPNPLDVDPDRNTPSIQGMGLHKCPGLSFVDHTMPELFKAIFRLKNLRREPGRAGQLERLVLHQAPSQTDPKVFMDSTGEMSHFPRSLTLLFDEDDSQKHLSTKLKRKRNWKVDFGSSTRKLRNVVDSAAHRLFALLFAVVLLLLLAAFFSRVSSFRLPSFRLPSFRVPRPTFKFSKREARPIPKVTDIRTVAVDCPPPTTLLHQWEINTFVPGPDGHPLPIEYTLDHPTAHKLSIVDIDAMDTRMAIYIDKELRGLTRDFELNKTVTCGENVKACLTNGFSAGMVIVEPGSHTIKVEWAGKEFINGTDEINWGEESEHVRRFKWRREYCS